MSESWSLETSVYHYKHSGVNLTVTRKEILQMNVLAGCLMKKALLKYWSRELPFLSCVQPVKVPAQKIPNRRSAEIRSGNLVVLFDLEDGKV